MILSLSIMFLWANSILAVTESELAAYCFNKFFAQSYGTTETLRKYPYQGGKNDRCFNDHDCANSKLCHYSKKLCDTDLPNSDPRVADCSYAAPKQDPFTMQCGNTDFPNRWMELKNAGYYQKVYGNLTWDRRFGFVSTNTRPWAVAMSLEDNYSKGIVCETSFLRSAAGLQPIVWDNCLSAAAGILLYDMHMARECFPEFMFEETKKTYFMEHCGEDVMINVFDSMNWYPAGRNSEDSGAWIVKREWFDTVGMLKFPVRNQGGNVVAGPHYTYASSETCMRNTIYHSEADPFRKMMWHDITKMGCYQSTCGPYDDYILICAYAGGSNMMNDNSPVFSYENYLELNDSAYLNPFDGLPICYN
ncbi:uncharacterized protein LOC134841377 [Symsagittifera roscoffensis]|uniref:uncharacterized protein LOC134841377 n=1 Tax=Symsagittifera roscoffensis TaxID=84072 RepID=UPI00307CC55B